MFTEINFKLGLQDKGIEEIPNYSITRLGNFSVKSCFGKQRFYRE